jgi:hypothetical protein
VRETLRVQAQVSYIHTPFRIPRFRLCVSWHPKSAHREPFLRSASRRSMPSARSVAPPRACRHKHDFRPSSHEHTAWTKLDRDRLITSAPPLEAPNVSRNVPLLPCIISCSVFRIQGCRTEVEVTHAPLSQQGGPEETRYRFGLSPQLLRAARQTKRVPRPLFLCAIMETLHVDILLPVTPSCSSTGQTHRDSALDKLRRSWPFSRVHVRVPTERPTSC